MDERKENNSGHPQGDRDGVGRRLDEHKEIFEKFLEENPELAEAYRVSFLILRYLPGSTLADWHSKRMDHLRSLAKGIDEKD